MQDHDEDFVALCCTLLVQVQVFRLGRLSPCPLLFPQEICSRVLQSAVRQSINHKTLYLELRRVLVQAEQTDSCSGGSSCCIAFHKGFHGDIRAPAGSGWLQRVEWTRNRFQQQLVVAYHLMLMLLLGLKLFL